MTALSELLKRANDVHRMSTRKRAERIGNRLHFATIADYQRGDHPAEPDETVLQALAEAYDLDLADVQRAAAVPVGAGSWQPPPEVARLTGRQQAAITELILAIAKEGGVGNEPQPRTEPEEPTPMNQAGTPPANTDPDMRARMRRAVEAAATGPNDEPGPDQDATVHQFPGREGLPENLDELAARTEQGEPVGERRRREQDEAAEHGDNGDTEA